MERMKGVCESANTLLGLQEAEARSRGREGLWFLFPEEEKKDDPGAKGPYGSGLETCTEGLGCESCDGGAMTTEEVARLEMGTSSTAEEGRKEEEEEEEKRLWREKRAFPPPLRCRRRCMRAVRRNGRLILKEVMIERPEVLHARREGGRLRLHLIEYESTDEAKGVREEEEEEEEEERDRRRSEKGIWRCQEAVSGAATRSSSSWDNRFMTAA